jgi:hypothetical protein
VINIMKQTLLPTSSVIFMSVRRIVLRLEKTPPPFCEAVLCAVLITPPLTDVRSFTRLPVTMESVTLAKALVSARSPGPLFWIHVLSVAAAMGGRILLAAQVLNETSRPSNELPTPLPAWRNRAGRNCQHEFLSRPPRGTLRSLLRRQTVRPKSGV